MAGEGDVLKMTPDELAVHLGEIAEKHGARLTEIEFLTFSGAAVGTHSYRSIHAQRLDQPLPDTLLVAKD